MIILDTHIWFWFITQEFDRFPSDWLEIIEVSPQVGVSPVSCYEIALARQRGRLELPCPTDQWFADALEPSGIELLPITASVAYQAVNLSPVPRDPFDRLIIATSLGYNARLASIDGLFSRYPELSESLMSAEQ